MKGSLSSVEYSPKNSSYFVLTMNQKVTVTESFYKLSSIEELLSSLGGVLGLWLGVGLMQTLQYGISIISWTNSIWKPRAKSYP